MNGSAIVRCDVLVAGSGAGGMAAAVAARLHGLDVIVAEKEALFGGTTAISGGGLWLPNSSLARGLGAEDSPEAVRTYLEHEVGNRLDADLADAFIAAAPRMVDFFQSRTAVQFLAAPGFPDYHPTAPGSRPGRTLRAAPYDARALGRQIELLRPPLPQMTVLGMLAVSGEEVLHFMRATRSAASALYVSRVVSRHLLDLAVRGRGTRLTNGNALAARLLRAGLDAGVSLWNSSAVDELITDGGRVVGAVVRRPGGSVRVECRRGVVLACGGFPANDEMRTRIFPHPSARVRHWWPGPPGNTGDGIRLGESVGGAIRNDHTNVAAWTPFSLVPVAGGGVAPFPHFVDRGKPGIIAVGPDGRRFVNESNSYHDVVEALLARSGEGSDVHAFMIADRRAIRRYGLGFAKPFPFPLQPYLRSGYLVSGASLRELAGRLGIDADALEETVRRFNGHARDGADPEFGRGQNVYNRYMGDPFHTPNPCLAPLETPPFYAVRLVPGELATFPGLAVDRFARVVDGQRKPIGGLYAAGNDMASIMGGGYPGPGITLGPAMTFGYIAGNHLAGIEEP
ncbi:FAD-dependent oxidoreductase [Arenibaculum pallidiluteum]|uniref:FAD-dependent oxidoreductase n=1 Tax=Arenibaculum pallidiluteum TaxID=2812559 RepID=UPI001A961BDF|nr:FAD-dependent oxidoreductase [Arenibaculum pallidiluteum]